MNLQPPSTETSSIRSADWLAPLLCAALLALLFPIPGARMGSVHPWRAELLTTVFLCVGIIVFSLQRREFLSGMFSFDAPWIKCIVASIAAFTAWSLMSALWAQSVYSVWHHTLVWTQYILVLLFVREVAAHTRGSRFIVNVFLWLCGIVGVLCLIDYATLPDFKSLEGVLRARYSSYAELLVTALPIVWIAAAYTRRKKKLYIMLLIAAAGWTAAMLSLSKGAFLAGIVGFSLTFICSVIFGLRRFRRRILVCAGVWLAITLVVQVGFSLLTPIPATVDYISGKADATRSTSTARVFVWKIGRQMAADNWLLGVGANNFGVRFNSSRAQYRVAHPDDPKDETVSDNTVERAHNEGLQILAELGIIGFVLIIIPLAVFLFKLVQSLRLRKFRGSPMLWAALGGMSAFAVSSMVSSFSFRLTQSGIVFFLVFAVAVNEIVKMNKPTPDRQPSAAPSRSTSIPILLAFILVGMLTIFSLKAAAEYCVFKADRTEDKETALELYRRALSLDPNYAAAYLRSSGRNYVDKDHDEAARLLRLAIDHGYGVVLTYSALADSNEKAGDPVSAEQTFKEALRIFPRSVFLRVRYALFLNDEGRSDASAAEMATARAIDERQANGWFNIITIGSVRTFYAAQTDKTMAPPAELEPEDAVLQYLDKPPGSDEDKADQNTAK